MNQQIVRKKINKEKPEPPRQPIPAGIMKLLQAMGKIKTVVDFISGESRLVLTRVFLRIEGI